MFQNFCDLDTTLKHIIFEINNFNISIIPSKKVVHIMRLEIGKDL